MKLSFFTTKMILILGLLLWFTGLVDAQTLNRAIATNQSGNTWQIEFKFDANVDADKIKINVFDPINEVTIPLGDIKPTTKKNIYNVFTTTVPLETTILPKTNKPALKPYLLNVQVKDADGNIDLQSIKIELRATSPLAEVGITEASDIDDADLYVDGVVQGAHKRKTNFSTNIKLQRTRKINNWKHTPFFRLNASTDPDADPDSMEFGYKFRYMFTAPIDLDNEAKIESERDFDNTNLIFASRLIYMRAGDKIGEITQPNGKKSPVQIFFRPYIGVEVGKNLRSPLSAAEGDGIARVLAGAALRLNIPLDRENGRLIDWTNSFTRRWLLSSELGFEADEDGNLQLTRFGKSPRDYFKSNFSYSFNKSFGAFVEYDWGQVPPSYKLVDHRFRVGFFYKAKFGIK
jgi:hypothetical protein